MSSLISWDLYININNIMQVWRRTQTSDVDTSGSRLHLGHTQTQTNRAGAPRKVQSP